MESALVVFILASVFSGVIFNILQKKFEKFKDGLPPIVDGYFRYTFPIKKIKQLFLYLLIGTFITGGSIVLLFYLIIK